MRADLHLHSVFSDGRYTPEEVCIRAKNNGVQLISVTDHDSMNGEDEKRAMAKKYGLYYLSGWEISAYEGVEKIHITGYNCQRKLAYLEFLKERVTTSVLRAEDSVKKLNAMGIAVTMDEVLANRTDDTAPLHTMHISKAIEQKTGMPACQAYEDYLAPNMPASSLVGRPTPEQAINCIHECGGIACIAHPGRIQREFKERENLVRSLKKLGVDGIEVYYPTHTEKETRYFLGLAKELSLLVTGGSDTHYESEERKIGTPSFCPSKELLESVNFLSR